MQQDSLVPPPPLLQLKGSQALIPENQIVSVPVPTTHSINLIRRNFNVKMGDTIYFKSYLSDDFKGVVSGDGIASNKLECVHLLGKNPSLIVNTKPQVGTTLQNKTASLSFNKCLFMVQNAKKYQYQNYLANLETSGEIRDEKLETFKIKANEEQEENQRIYKHLHGTNLVYGQEIQLTHHYSGCTLTLNDRILARQNCCRELSLEEKPQANSNFRILSYGNAKNVGEPVLYGDQIVIRSTVLSQWAIGIQRPGRDNTDLEVNASEVPASLKVSCYIDYKTDQEIDQQQIKGKYLQSGDVITLKNRSLSGYLAIKRKLRITDQLIQRGLQFKDYETNTFKEVKQEYFDVEGLQRQAVIDAQYQLYVEQEEGETLATLWQIQHKDSLNYLKATYESVFLLKHVCTGLFLQISGEYDTQHLTLTYDGTQPSCQFQLRSKKNAHDQIAYSEACRIQSYIEPSLLVQCLDRNYVKMSKKSQKKNLEQCIFLLHVADESQIKIANRLNSLQTYLLQFYLFLQEWGQEIKLNSQIYYEYYKAFNDQKVLFDQIQQLFQSLENLRAYLTNDGKPQSSEDLGKKQASVQENDIINLLFAILHLCNFMIFGHAPKHYTIPEKSPQKIAKLKLDPERHNCIREIYSILQLCVQSNAQTSDFVLKLKIHSTLVLDFLLSQLRFQRLHVSNLLKESIRYTDLSDTHTSLSNWVKQLDIVSEENIEDQTLYVEILSLMMIDPLENPSQNCQNLCRKQLMRKSSRSGSVTPFHRGLIQCSLHQDLNQDFPFIKFIAGNNSDSGATFAMQNGTFAKLYSKYVEKLTRSEGRFHDFRPQITEITVDFFTTATIKRHKLIRQEDMKNELPVFQKYENFILNVLGLYASLCKGRNHKSIRFLKEHCGINAQFLRACLKHFQNDPNELRFERTILSLFVNLSLDIDPLTSVTRFQNKTYLKEDLEKFDIKSYSGGFFYESNVSKALREGDEFKDFIQTSLSKKVDKSSIVPEHQLLRIYAQRMIMKQQQMPEQILNHYLNLFMSRDYPEHLEIECFDDPTVRKQNYNYELYALYQLEYFLSLLTLIRSAIDLGYNDIDTNRKIYDVLPNIFVAITLQQTRRQPIYKFDNCRQFKYNKDSLLARLNAEPSLKIFDKDPQDINQEEDAFNLRPQRQIRTWILEFLIWTTPLCSDQLLVMKIYLEALQILKVFQALKVNLQILSFIGEESGNQSCINEGSKASSVRNSYDPDQQKSSLMDVLAEKNGLNMSALLFNCLFSSEKRTILNEELISVLISTFKLPQYCVNEIREVELIDDQIELNFFTVVNGNSSTNEWLSPKEADLEANRCMKYIKLSKTSSNTSSSAKPRQEQSFLKLVQYQGQILEQFDKVMKETPTYLQAFQNILRNSEVHLVFSKFLIDPKQIRSTEPIVQFYKNVIRFFELFCMGNLTNIREIAKQEFLYSLLKIAQLKQTQAENIMYIPLKITRLIKIIISSIPVDHSNIIRDIFYQIAKLGAQLVANPLFSSLKEAESPIEVFQPEPYQLILNSPTPPVRVAEVEVPTSEAAIQMASIIQYLKILRFLTATFEKPAKQVPANKHLILTSMLKTEFVQYLIIPTNFFEHILLPDKASKLEDSSKLEVFYCMQLHANVIALITDCCKYNRLGIQEAQRILLYEQLKTVLLSPSGYYIVKKAYLQCLFELYINRVVEGNQINEIVDNDEVRDILSRIIIPELDQKQIQKYLEGLARLNSSDKCMKKESVDLRNQIKRQKRDYFEKRQNLSQEAELAEAQILRDVSEFWKYIRKNGIIHFLVYTYDEMKDRVDLEKGEESNLSDEFAIIKQSVQKIKDIFNVLERDFRMKKEDLDLDEYRDLITSIEEIIPQRKITKFGQNFRIGFHEQQLVFDKYDTLKEDQAGDKKLQEQDNVQRIENQFQRNFKIYLIRNFVTIQELNAFIDAQNLSEMERYGFLVKTCNRMKVYITDQDVTNIKTMDVERIIQQEKVNNPSKVFNNWEVFKQAMLQLFQKKQSNILEITQRLKDEKRLIQIKQNFEQSIQESVKDELRYLVKRQDVEASNYLSPDVQIKILIMHIERQQDILNKQALQSFLRKCQDIFLGYEIYLIKLCRIFLESKMPSEDEIQSLSEQGNSDADQIKKKLSQFREFQFTIAEGEIDTIALQFISNPSISSELQLEAIVLLVTLLEYGNELVQKRFLSLLKSSQNVKNSFITFLREFFQTDLNSQLQEIKNNHKTLFEELCLKVLKLLQGLCENVNVEFQKFLVIQNEDDSYASNMNIVNEVSNLLANLLEDQLLNFGAKNRMIRQAMESLIEFSTGYPENKAELCKNTRLFTLMNQIVSPKLETNGQQHLFKPATKSEHEQEAEVPVLKPRYEGYQTLESFVKLLLAMTQGNATTDSLRFILEMIDVATLLATARDIFEQRVQPKYDNIVLDNMCDESTGIHAGCSNYFCLEGLRTDEDFLLIKTGFNIFIICMKLSESFPEDPQLEIFQFDQEKDDDLDDEVFRMERGQSRIQSSRSQVLPMQHYEQISQEDIDLKFIAQQVNNDPNLNFNKDSRKERFFKFYREYTGRIEIQNPDKQLEKVYFQKPFLCRFMTPNIKYHLIFESKRETDEDRMLSLIENSDFYQIQLLHSQKMTNRRILDFGARYWRVVKDISFLLCIVIVILLIFMHDTVINSKIGSNQEAPEDTEVTAGEIFVSYLNNIITIIQLILNLMIIFFCSIERYPISITYRKGETNAKKIQVLKKESGFSISSINMIYYTIIGYLERNFEEKQVQNSMIRRGILVVLLDFDNLYNICIFGLTCYAFFNPYIYAIMLLDVVKRSEDLQNIIRSITSNGRNLAIFSFLGLIGLLIYGIIAFNNFDGDFDEEEAGVYGNSFILAVTTVINFGLRNGGGFGESMKPYPNPDELPEYYWGRYFFDFTFFIIFNILFIQIIFGIILDTFGELRDERQALIKEIEGKCFVCSLSRNEIDTKGQRGWFYHIYLEHNCYHMLYYIIYLKSRNLNDCNALEKYVKECIDKKLTDFFPFNRALQIEDTDQTQ